MPYYTLHINCVFYITDIIFAPVAINLVVGAYSKVKVIAFGVDAHGNVTL